MVSSRVNADVRRLTDSFEHPPAPEARPGIIVVSGLPGTGKTYFCRRLAERLPCIVLESDALRKQLFPAPDYSGEESVYLFRTIYRVIEELVKKGSTVALDATNLAERHRERLYSIAERLNARLVLVSVDAPPELVQERLRRRVKEAGNKSDASWKVYQQMKPTEEKIKRRHFTVDTSRDITPVIEKVIKEVKR
ncbi:MAG: ATP-binding protein [Dehalococcoidales bacterium]|jgi:predicted kinase